MAIVSLSYLFGDAVAREFMAVLIGANFGWRAVFVTDAGVLTAILAVCLLLLRETPRQIGEAEPSVNPANLFGAEADRDRPRNIRALLAPLLKSGVFWLACLLSLGTTILRETFGLWTPTYFTQATGMSPASAAGMSALFPFFGGVSVILCGWLSDRLGRTGRAALVFYGLGLAGFALLALSSGLMQGSRFWPVAIVALVAFLIIGPYSFLGGAIALDFGGRQGSGTASGMIDGVGYLGGVLAGDSMARISVSFGWSGAFIVLAVVAFLSSAAGAAFLRHEKRIAA
jgi:OPA family glycerol-3-phosphate transporter-like MFS transporter